MNEGLSIFESSQRIGKFRVSAHIIANSNREDNNRDFLHLLFGRCIIIQAGYNFEHDAFEYLAFSDLFEEITPGALIPYYLIDVENMENQDVPNLSARKI